MKVAIVVFSSSGNTLKVAKMLEKSLETKNIAVQVVNIRFSENFSAPHRVQQFLQEHVTEHDVLCIGSPVYAHHFQYHVKDVIAALPDTKDGWGKFVVPFVTYGGISSGIALEEAGKLLKNQAVLWLQV